ncbi:MAG: hypothetical protein ABW000_22365 [Actinoplanes sp.]
MTQVDHRGPDAPFPSAADRAGLLIAGAGQQDGAAVARIYEVEIYAA